MAFCSVSDMGGQVRGPPSSSISCRISWSAEARQIMGLSLKKAPTRPRFAVGLSRTAFAGAMDLRMGGENDEC